MAEASRDSTGLLFHRRNATRRVEAEVSRSPNGDKTGCRRSASAPEIENGGRTSGRFYTSDENISPVACLSRLERRQRPASGVSIESSSSYMSVSCQCYMEDSDMGSSWNSSVGYVSIRGENFMSDSENEQSSMLTFNGLPFSSIVSYRTVTGSSDRRGRSASPPSTMISGKSYVESTFIFDPPKSTCPPQNNEECTCTKCGHVHKVTTNQLFINVLNLPPKHKRHNTFPCEFKDLLQLQFWPSITDTAPVGCDDALANTIEMPMPRDYIPLVKTTNHQEVSEIASVVAADLDAALRLNRLDAEGLYNLTEERVAEKRDEQRLCELKTYRDDFRQIPDDRTQPKELLSNTYGDGNTQPKVLLCVNSDYKSYIDYPQPDTLLPGVSEDKSVTVTEPYLRCGVTRHKLYSVYDNVQRCWICGTFDNNKSNKSGSNLHSNSRITTGVEYFCKKSNLYFCSLCKQEHKKRIPNCVIIVREH